MREQYGSFDIERNAEYMEQDYTARKIADGLGYGEGSISAAALKEQVGDEVFAAAEHVINSPDILIAVDHDDNGELVDDDGCGDGRKWKRVFRGAVEKARSLNRAKVFGGGAAMAAATLIGRGEAHGKS